MDKATLRDLLFNRYFQIENGVSISDFLEKLSFIPETWKKMHLLCQNNIKYFNSFSKIESCKMLEYGQKNYFIIKLRAWRYVIIDLDKMESITDAEFRNNFDEDFFVNNFAEEKEEDESLYSKIYNNQKYEGDIHELVDFYIENKNIMSLTSKLHYKIVVGNAWTWFFVDFVNPNVQMGFQTIDRSLYEQLFLKYDLTASTLQDAQEKMGIEKMQEFFSKIKDMKIPIDCIPYDLYQQYLIQCDTVVNKRTLK